MTRRRWLAAGVPAAAAVVVAAVLLLRDAAADPPPRSLADAVPYDGRSPREPSARGTRVVVALPRPSLGGAGIATPRAQRAYVRSLREEAAALRSALGARGVRLSDIVTYARTFNGFAATVRTRDLADLPVARRARAARAALLPGVEPAGPDRRAAPAAGRRPARRRLDRRARHGRRRRASAAGRPARPWLRRHRPEPEECQALFRFGGDQRNRARRDPRRRRRARAADPGRRPATRHAGRPGPRTWRSPTSCWPGSSAPSTPTATAPPTITSRSRWSASTRPTPASPARPRRGRSAARPRSARW